MSSNTIQEFYEDDDARHRSLEAYHRAREARAELASTAVKFVRDRPGTCIALGALAWWLIRRSR
jgi:hypothetical protein